MKLRSINFLCTALVLMLTFGIVCRAADTERENYISKKCYKNEVLKDFPNRLAADILDLLSNKIKENDTYWKDDYSKIKEQVEDLKEELGYADCTLLQRKAISSAFEEKIAALEVALEALDSTWIELEKLEHIDDESKKGPKEKEFETLKNNREHIKQLRDYLSAFCHALIAESSSLQVNSYLHDRKYLLGSGYVFLVFVSGGIVCARFCQKSKRSLDYKTQDCKKQKFKKMFWL